MISTGVAGNMRQPIRIISEKPGDFTIDAEVLAERFTLSTAELRDLMARNLVHSTVELGEGEDAGNWRLTLRCGNRMWRAIVTADGTLQHEEVRFTGRSLKQIRPTS
jgi:hypothetical protein